MQVRPKWKRKSRKTWIRCEHFLISVFSPNAAKQSSFMGAGVFISKVKICEKPKAPRVAAKTLNLMPQVLLVELLTTAIRSGLHRKEEKSTWTGRWSQGQRVSGALPPSAGGALFPSLVALVYPVYPFLNQSRSTLTTCGWLRFKRPSQDILGIDINNCKKDKILQVLSQSQKTSISSRFPT